MSVHQLSLDLPISIDYSEASFTVRPCNQNAWTLIHQWPNWAGPLPFFAIYGEEGSGKTHLAHIWEARAKATFLTPELCLSAAPRDLTDFAEEGSAFVLDDGEKVTNQEWLFDFYNILAEKKASLLICSQNPPMRWPFLTLPDLRSRLSTIVAIEVTLPDEVTLEAIMLKEFSDRGIEENLDVIRYLLPRIDRSFRRVHRVIADLDRYALTHHRAISVHLAREMLEVMDEQDVV